jgi:hypothetical protein
MTLLRLAELENEVFALRLANARIPILEAENAALKEKAHQEFVWLAWGRSAPEAVVFLDA